MASIYGILHVGKQALLTHQEALNVTAHNIANVNTPGYSRQRVVLETTTPITTGAGQVGSGVTVSRTERIYDRYLNNQINNENETLGRWEAEKGGVERVEVVFNEALGYGLNQSMSEFWNGWQDLANNPSGHTERQILLGAGETLAYNFQQTYNDLAAIRTELDNNISQAVSQVNVKADQIADLNQKIVQIESKGDNANDYRDKRDLALKELSLMIDITASEEDNGSVTVTLGDGNKLVEGSTAPDLSTMTNASGFRDVVWASAPAVSINSDISGGKLKGWLEVRDVTIPEYTSNLTDLANGIRDKVNALHDAGFDLSGAPAGNFFVGDGILEDDTFAVDSTIIADVNTIAASRTDTGAPGDNSNAIAIANLQNTLTMSGSTATFDDYYNSIVSSTGYAVQQATFSYNHQDSLVNYLENYRESISGVSLDEEMINMLQFESAYAAAAKLISKIDEMLQILMGMI